MLVRLYRNHLNGALVGAELLLGALALSAERSVASLVLLCLLLGVGLYGWAVSVRYARLISDTPTSRIASAAQGYAELHGRGRPLTGDPVLSPVNGLPVLWYRIEHYRRSDDGGWRYLRTVESDASFLLDDGSGVCAVDPEGAQMLVRRKDEFTRGDERQIQWCLLSGAPVYVLGDFVTLGSITGDFDISAQTGELLAEWKRDRGALLERFDLDCDGEISLREWGLARAQARREVLARQREILDAPEAHVLRKPADRRLYLVSDLSPGRIARQYWFRAVFHLAVFLGSAAGIVWLYNVITA